MKNIARCLRLVLPMAPFKLMIFFFISFPSAIMPIFLLNLEKKILENLTGELINIRLCLIIVFFMIVLYALMKFFSLMSEKYMEFDFFLTIDMKINKEIHNKISELSLESYDNTEKFRIIEKGKNASMFIIFTANMFVLSILLIVTLVSTSFYLANFDIRLIIFSLLVAAPIILEKFQISRQSMILIDKIVQPLREQDYIKNLFFSYEAKKEISLSGSSDYFADKYLDLSKKINSEEKRVVKKKFMIGSEFVIFKTTFRIAALALSTYLLLTKKINLAEFSVTLTSFAVLTSNFDQLFGFIGEIMETAVMSQPFFDLIDMDNSEIERKTLTIDEDIVELKNVSYKYLGSNSFAINNVSFKLRENETVAIVGLNGAGKTTLVKLMCGLLLPTSGQVIFAGEDTKTINEECIFNNITSLFQEFGKYKMSIADNVVIGDHKKILEIDKLEESLIWSGLYKSFSDVNTMLGKEFGGTELSGGQWQSLALARCKYRVRPIVFLDEPTSAIDPIYEASFFSKIMALKENKSMVIITHRLGSVKNVDRILVFDCGKLIEIGDFNTLIRNEKKFSEIWNEQKKWYEWS